MERYCCDLCGDTWSDGEGTASCDLCGLDMCIPCWDEHECPEDPDVIAARKAKRDNENEKRRQRRIAKKERAWTKAAGVDA